MNIEKVKKIKEYLQEEVFIATKFEDKLRRIPTRDLQKILNLINELESENKSLQDLCNKTYEDLTKEIDRLEKGSKDYYDRLNNLQTYIDNHEEIWEGNTNNVLKQFAERLKEKAVSFEGERTAIVSFKSINEVLKEFLGK